ncbi:peroxidase A2 [Selaginella moellendorffii]|uniref:peroxidase A2 n=1 Tax=Selaginella moellendorffii TaxID=88036 RepID=UPI000D1CB634|nr:peroxidase A2 [Selaginella moellendorffii]|eukprot:XP_024532919.1 peroxidase A2 [Selaginella moellendorffii]
MPNYFFFRPPADDPAFAFQGDGLASNYYAHSCPGVEEIARAVLEEAVGRDGRVGASLLLGCDGSILLDATPELQSEKAASPNRNSARGFEVIDAIKAAVERECEGVVSCADLLAIAARDSVVLSGGHPWEVLLGRRDSLEPNFKGANTDIPAPNSTLSQLIAAFANKGLSTADMVTLSGSHTIGFSRCSSFTQRLYDHQRSGSPDPDLDPELLRHLQRLCPRGGDANAIAMLDVYSPARFDNSYFANLQLRRGVLSSDQALLSVLSPSSSSENLSEDSLVSVGLVEAYAYDESRFLEAFGEAMVKLGSIALTGDRGEVRRDCRVVNSDEQ